MEIAAWLLDQDQAATWITERELLRDQLKGGRDLDGRLLRGPGRRPDGVLVRANNRRDAVEVELTPKRDRTEYDRKLALGVGRGEERCPRRVRLSCANRRAVSRMSRP
jgi:hypothetical protein